MTATDARGAPVTTASRSASAPAPSASTRPEAQAVQRWLPAPHPVTRIELAGAQTDRLYFAQVREDPRLEIEALAPRNDETIAIVGSGGCTALSLLASGAGRVVAIDLNRTQNHLIEIKLAALRLLTTRAALEFLGGLPLAEPVREATYIALRPLLSAAACEYWDGRREAIRGGVIASGVSERFIGVVVRAIRLFVHDEGRITRLLSCRSLDEQQEFYRTVWNSRRWRLLFRALLNRTVFRRAYDDAFFRHVENPSFARHFHALAERTLTSLPIADNYFVHQMLTGRYPVEEPNGVPPYLAEASGPMLAARAHAFTLVDGSFTDYLCSAGPASIHGFALSNICEWLTAAGIDALFAQILRTAAPGARICIRNFVGWTEIPELARRRLVVDEELSAHLSIRDRSAVQRRILVARVPGGDA